jgi:predicted ribosomally synthesized peptide with nif11-like leader
MSQIDDFKRKVIGDSSLRAELSTLAGKPRGEFIGGVSAIAARHGYALSESEIATAMDQQLSGGKTRDLSEAELEQVAAGWGELCGTLDYPPESEYF